MLEPAIEVVIKKQAIIGKQVIWIKHLAKLELGWKK
jgi:hypothetical protein